MNKYLIISLIVTGCAFIAGAETVAQQQGRAFDTMGNAQDTIAQVTLARFQQEQADRYEKIADQIRQDAQAARAAREQRSQDLEKEIECRLIAGLPLPTEATWRKPTAREEERAKFHDLMWDQMNARLHHE